MMDQHERTCNNCDYKVSYMWISDAHDPETVTQFVATILEGKLAGSPAVTGKCPQCKNELSLESTTRVPEVVINKLHECRTSDTALPETIASSHVALATEIRQFSIGQKELWQLIPSLELESEGRSGWLDNASLTYKYGLWMVGSSLYGGRASYAVDCYTGYLVWLNDYIEKKELHFLDDASVLSLSEELDAQAVVDNFKSHIKEYENPPSYCTDEDWVKNVKRREEIREKFNLGERFVGEKTVICGCRNCERILNLL